MAQDSVAEMITDFRHQVVDEIVAAHVPENAYPEQWDAPGLQEAVSNILNLDLPIVDWSKEEGIADEELKERIVKAADQSAASRAVRFGPDVMRQVEKAVLMQTLDHLWREHIVTLEHLRQVIGLRGYAQRDPLVEYKAEGFTLFEDMTKRLREAVTGQMMRIEVMQEPPQPELPEMIGHHFDPMTGDDEMAMAATAFAGTSVMLGEADAAQVADRRPDDPSTWGRVGRNEPCPCGSGKKYKHCHGQFV
jgi:preprotein translocase subunit SecA